MLVPRRARLLGLGIFVAIVVLYLGYFQPLGSLENDGPFAPASGLAGNNANTHHADADRPNSNGGGDKEAEDAEVPHLAPADTDASVVSAPVKIATVAPSSPTEHANAHHSTTDDGTDLEPTPTATAATPSSTPQCKKFEEYQRTRPGPASTGKRQFPYVRPPPECRTFHLPEMEDLIRKMRTVIADPDLFRLFENSYPNTLDTMIKWRGYAERNVSSGSSGSSTVTTEKDGKMEETVEKTDEELAYVITGDIDAMWLRDSASQIMSYLPLLTASTDPDSLASLWRGVINAHARYIVISPYCHSFQPPPESGIPPTHNGAYHQNHPVPPYDPAKVFDCKWELDSLASFLQLSAAYHARTGDAAFFGRFGWLAAVRAAVDAAAAMRIGTYDPDGRVLPSAWRFTGWTDRGSETLTNDGLGNPTRANGMVRSAFRPSDDATIFQLLVPANIMFAAYLEQASLIAETLAHGSGDSTSELAANLTTDMRDLAAGIRRGIDADAIVYHREFGDMFAYEVDGFGGANLMDDANVPSLLAIPLWNYTQASTTEQKDEDEKEKDTKKDYAQIYRNTRAFVLSPANPYFANGPILAAVGGPHLGPGKGWPMAAVVTALTALDPLAGIRGAVRRRDAVETQLRMVLDSTAGTGVVHESVNAWNDRDWTRAWFGWANGLFGELVLRIAEEEEREGLVGDERGLLGRLWQ